MQVGRSPCSIDRWFRWLTAIGIPALLSAILQLPVATPVPVFHRASSLPSFHSSSLPLRALPFVALPTNSIGIGLPVPVKAAETVADSPTEAVPSCTPR